jgi:hypothetical protein
MRDFVELVFICVHRSSSVAINSSPQHLNRPIMFPPVDDTRNFGRLLAVFAENAEFVFAVFAVPHGKLPAEEHCHTNLAGVGRYGILGHRANLLQ